MALKAILDSIEELSDDLKEHYKKDERTSKFVLDLEDFDGMPRVKSLKDENAQARIKNRDLTKVVDGYKALGELTDVQAKLDKYPELEAAAAGKLDETKLNELVEGRLKTKIAPIERERETLRGQVTDLGAMVEQFKSKETQRIICDSVRAAATKLKVTETAIEDATMYGDRLFTVDDSGAVVAKDNVGITPGISPEVWLTDMQSKRPHWWGPSQGGGAGGNRGGNSGGVNPWTDAHWNMTEQARIYKEDKTKAEQLAKNAGTTIGGLRPAKK